MSPLFSPRVNSLGLQRFQQSSGVSSLRWNDSSGLLSFKLILILTNDKKTSLVTVLSSSFKVEK